MVDSPPTDPDDRKTAERHRRGTCLFLVAAAGVAIAGLGWRVANSIMFTGARLKTKSAIKQLELAVSNFYHDYQRYPLPSAANDTDTRSDRTLLASLVAQNPTLNPDNTVYFASRPPTRLRPGIIETGNNTGALADSWGELFYLRFDTDGDSRIRNPDPTSLTNILDAGVLIYSAGPDRDPATWDDNVTSWY